MEMDQSVVDAQGRESRYFEAAAVAERLISRITSRQALVGVIGLGYFGLPLALAFTGKDFRVLGFDADLQKVDAINVGRSYIRHIAGPGIAQAVKRDRLSATAEYARLADVDAIILCVPTPLTLNREPDLSYVTASSRREATGAFRCSS